MPDRNTWCGVLGVCIMASSAFNACEQQRQRITNLHLIETNSGEVTALTHLFKFLLTSHRTLLGRHCYLHLMIEMLRYKKLGGLDQGHTARKRLSWVLKAFICLTGCEVLDFT